MQNYWLLIIWEIILKAFSKKVSLGIEKPAMFVLKAYSINQSAKKAGGSLN